MKQQRRVLGCSFPVFLIILIVVIVAVLLGVITGPIGKNALHLPGWLVTSQPEVSLPAEAVFHIGGFGVTNTLISAWFSIVVLVLFLWLVMRKSKLIPGRLQSSVEWILSWLLNLCETAAGEKNGRKFFPIIASIFLYVITNAWLSLLPFFNSFVVHATEQGRDLVFPIFRGANTDANVTLSIAIVSFIFVEYFGFKMLGLSYTRKFVNTHQFTHSVGQLFKGKVKSAFGGIFLGVVNIFVGFIEFITELIRIVSFTFRLFGNMTAGEILLGIIIFLIPWFAVSIFYGLEVLIGFIQAFVFCGLTLAFVSFAIIPHEEEHAEK
jgi:F-type H+-transporting ATPase subunit a